MSSNETLTDLGILSEYFSPDELELEPPKGAGINKRTQQRYNKLGIGPPVTYIGRKPYYKKSSFYKWLESQEQKPTRRSRA